MKVVFLAHSPAPYRVEFWNQLGKHCELSVIYEHLPQDLRHREPEWFSVRAETYREYLYEPYSFRRLSESLSCDIAVIGGYSSIPAWDALNLFRKRKDTAVLISADGGMATGWEHPAKRWTKSALLSLADGYLVPGDATEKYLSRYLQKQKPFYHYPFTSLCEADLQYDISREKARTCFGMQHPVIISTAGQMIRRKGFDVLREACSDLPEDTAVYLAGGPRPDWLEEHPRFFYPGFLDPLKMKCLMKASDLFVFPVRYDTWGLALSEAMAYGLPVISSDRCTAGTELIRDHENGVLVKTGDVQALHDAIHEFLKYRGIWKQYGKQAEKDLRRRTIERMVQAHLEAFRDIRRHRK